MSPSGLWAAALAAAFAAFGGGLLLHKDGPPPARTGGFGEPTCVECHVDAGLNAPGGSLAVTGIPRAYAPGRTYELIVSLRRPGMLRAGVELATRFADGEARATQAGTLAPGDAATRVVRDSLTGVEYLGHTLAGTALAGGGAARWAVRWTAPPDAGRGPVALHVAANAANDDDSPLGDFIYTRAVTIPPAQRR